MRVADDVRIRRQFKAYSGRQEDLQVGDYVYAAVLPAVTDSRKLCIKWSGPLVIKEQGKGNYVPGHRNQGQITENIHSAQNQIEVGKTRGTKGH